MSVSTVYGNVGKDAELRYLPSGDAVLNFSVAESEGKDKPTIWWRCAVFGKWAESLKPYVTSGKKIVVTGKMTKQEFTDKTGVKRESLELKVIDLNLIRDGSSNDSGGSSGAKKSSGKNAYYDAKNGAPVPDDDVNDIPF